MMAISSRLSKSKTLSLSALMTVALSGCLGVEGPDAAQDETVEETSSVVADAVPAEAEHEAPDEASLAEEVSLDEADPRSISSYEPKMHWSGRYSYAKTDIKSHDGITLRAVVTEPAGPGPHPLIVMPSSWALNRVEYSVPARNWAEAGFVVVSYTSRGFYRSGGVIDISDKPTVDDVSAVIDWAGKHTKADLDRVGAAGISYGAGSSLLAAAQDSRIDAVVSMSGWADLQASMMPHDTVGNQIAKLLGGAAEITGKPGALLKEVPEIVEEGRQHELIPEFATRSAMNRLDDLRGTPILIAHAWNDGAFPMSQMHAFYRAHQGPKAIIMQPGDHATADIGGLLGLPNRSWDGALAWMKKHVKGESIDCGPAVVSVSNDNKWERSAKSLDAWEGKKRNFALSDPWQLPFFKIGELKSSGSSSAWGRSMQSGKDTIANSGTVMLNGSKLGFFSLPEMISPTFVLRDRAMMWKTPLLRRGQHIAGAPELNLSIKPRSEEVSFFAYLYEEVAGVASLITHAPMTLRELEVGKEVSLSMKLEPVDWHLVPGSKLVLIVDTMDPRYKSESKRGEVKLLSTQEQPAMLMVPMRGEQ